ncbi:Entericidin EcnA/B family protein [Erythrobacter aurantius]|jgi:predicted small secreted protein|uniref:Entericidin EcnA/B family protein n=1 Tax=Erythrobacter aurantius TaxID=2909249 RepID=UPI002E81B40A|nr:Entericidin EcnA/B family protein [Erythrobacter aurantius]
MIRKIVLTAALGAFALGATGCNTVKGLGRDIESVGRKGEEVISHAPPASREEAQPAR